MTKKINMKKRAEKSSGKSNEKRAGLSKYQLGNGLFYLLSTTLGMLSFLYLSYTVQFFYEIFPVRTSYHLILSAGFFIICGLCFLFIRKSVNLASQSRGSFFSVFVYLALALFSVLFFGTLLVNVFPDLALYVFIPVYVVFAVLLSLLMFFWRRHGGRRSVIFFFLGVFFSGLINRFYLLDTELLINSVRLISLVFLIFLLAQFFGLWGMFKVKRCRYFILSLIVLFVTLYPMDIKEVEEELRRYRWDKVSEAAGTNQDYVASYQSGNKRTDVFINRTLGNEDIFSFLNNGEVSVYTYPLSKKHEYAFYYAFLQNIEPLKRVLIVGDMPMGFVNIISKIHEKITFDYVPLDKDYVTIWGDFLNYGLLKKINTINNSSDLAFDYDMVFVFPPDVSTGGGTYYLDHSYLRSLRSRVSVGTLIVVISKGYLIGVQDLVRKSLEGLFKEILYVKQSSDVNFVIATDLRANITSDPMSLKDRFIRSGINEQYSKVREYIDSNTPLVSASFGIMDDLNGGFYTHSNILRIGLIICFMVFITMFLLNRFQSSELVLSNMNALLWSIFMGSLFGSMVLYRQKFFIDTYSTFNSLLSVFLLGIVLGIGLASRLMSSKWSRKKIFYLILGISGVVVLACLLIFMNLWGFSVYYPYIFLLLAGVVSSLIFFTKHWYTLKFTPENLHSICSICFLGLGVGFFIFGIFDAVNLSFVAITYLMAVYAGLFFTYNIVAEEQVRL